MFIKSRWLSVWCNAFDVNFGELTFPARFNYPRPQKISRFDGIHDVSSDKVVVVDAQTFLIPNFTYDGQAPDAHFWVGQGKRPGPEVQCLINLYILTYWFCAMSLRDGYYIYILFYYL